MGEMVVSSENEEKRENKEGPSSMVRWERFLPRTALRVLLVEADDSTRQIIGALLRKCSYKVASVSDGLKAWEVLKERQHNIDLILTEVDLPSISGYALLTLIMEHQLCKNIPVIMMSSYDSVGTVYKCMLKGAADFLVKPIRINELKNLWQHVWRRQSMSGQRFGPQDESVGQQKLEATAENNAAMSDHSSSSKTCSPRQVECIKKGSDAQSSCGKLGPETKNGYMDEVENHSQLKQMRFPVSNLNIPEYTNHANSGHNSHTPESAVAGSHTAAGIDNNTLVLDGRFDEQQSRGDGIGHCAENSKNMNILANTSEAIDLIGSLQSCSRLYSSVNDVTNNNVSSPELDLSLRGSFSENLETKAAYEKQMLNHSKASAFSKYVNKQSGTSNANATYASSTIEGDNINVGAHLFDNTLGSNTNTKDSSNPYDNKGISFPADLTKDLDNECQSASRKLLPIPFSVRGTQVDVCAATPAGYRSTIAPVVSTPSPSLSPNSTNQQVNLLNQFSIDVINARQHCQPLDQSPRISSNQSISKQDLTLASLEERAQFSCATDQSGSSTLGNATAGNSSGFGSGNVQQDAVVPGGSESGNEQGHISHDLSSQRSIQREAALMKFRLKRKERCYEKKVRYVSRKKLAEQRPRVKGQFVRQVPADPPPPRTYYNSGGNSVTN